jgi:hypothetical protein
MENIGSIGHAIVLAISRLCQPLLQVAVPGFSTATYTASVRQVSKHLQVLMAFQQHYPTLS